MLRGMMMDRPLLVSSVIDYAAEIYPDVQVVSQTVEGGLHRYGYAAARERIGRLQELAREALDELGSLVFELRPPDLARDGLDGALRKHVEVLRRLGHEQLELSVSGAPPADGARDAEVLRIAQEAIQNALRHANAGRIAVSLAGDDGRLLLLVEDDGIGFDPGATEVRSRRLGLTSMEERARRIGATLEVVSSPGAGTTVRLEAADV